MKPGLRGADGDPQRGRDLGHLEVEVIAEHDDRALFGRQSAKDRFEQVTVSGDGRDVADGRAIRREELDLVAENCSWMRVDRDDGGYRCTNGRRGCATTPRTDPDREAKAGCAMPG